MTLSHLAIQLMLAIACGIVGNILIPRQIPGRFLGLIVVGLVGVWLGEWAYLLIKNQYGFNHALLSWKIESVPVIPSVIGSAIVIYLVTGFLKIFRYSR
jgi:uncharacterized membrane protein YeaQ/YmgE (transglycosylase-associated protein family)